MSRPLNTRNTSLYRITNSILLEEDIYQFNLTLLKISDENSGWYATVIDDGFTEPSVDPMQLVSVEFPAEVRSVFSSHTCLVAGEVVLITCEFGGLLEPLVSFLKNGKAFQLNECQSCTIFGNVLTFFAVTRDDQGSYGCTAEDTNEGNVDSDSGSLNDGLVFVYCDHPEES